MPSNRQMEEGSINKAFEILISFAFAFAFVFVEYIDRY